MQLKRHPEWSYHGEGTPGWRELMEQRNRVIERHPRTTFVVAHMAEAANDYALLSSWLDRYPNMMVDLSARENEIGRQPRASRAFFIKYADRILFGTDRYPGRLDQPRNRVYYRILETDDEYFDYYDHPFAPMGEWKVYGLALPDDVLVKIYRDNAKRVLALR
jgi:predicted TIM-barrel fold metal-dependent hydrolase